MTADTLSLSLYLRGIRIELLCRTLLSQKVSLSSSLKFFHFSSHMSLMTLSDWPTMWHMASCSHLKVFWWVFSNTPIISLFLTSIIYKLRNKLEIVSSHHIIFNSISTCHITSIVAHVHGSQTSQSLRSWLINTIYLVLWRKNATNGGFIMVHYCLGIIDKPNQQILKEGYWV